MAHEMAVIGREDATGNFKIVLTTKPGLEAEGASLREVLGAVAGHTIESGEDTETHLAVEGHPSIAGATISVKTFQKVERTEPVDHQSPYKALG